MMQHPPDLKQNQYSRAEIKNKKYQKVLEGILQVGRCDEGWWGLERERTHRGARAG